MGSALFAKPLCCLTEIAIIKIKREVLLKHFLEFVMSRKVTRVKYHLDSKGIKELPNEEIVAILRAADDLIMSGGRNLLSKLLKGSKEKKIIELGLDKNPFYGFYSDISLEDILAKIDWSIKNNYLAIEYVYRLPLLVFTEEGWEIEKDTYSTELLIGFDKMIDSGANYFNMNYLKDKNRGSIFLLLDKVKATKDKKYIPILEAWREIDYKKVKQKINQVINSISQNAT
jgi:superfamily II DNA helicase RecQ